jgi:hypothetical protein
VTGVGQGGEILVVFRRGNLKERDHLVVLYVDGRLMLKWVLKKENEWVLTGLIWHRTGRRDALLVDDNKTQG